MSSAPTSAPSFGQLHFGAAQLGDRRRTRSLIDFADRCARHPRGSLPEKCGEPHALARCYHLFNGSDVTHAAVLQPHRDHTQTLVTAHPGVVRRVHDITELDSTGHTTWHDALGPIGDGHGQGYLCLTSLAVDPVTRQALGLLGQILHCRPQVPPHETQAQKRDRTDRESRLWVQATPDLPTAPPGQLGVDVIDRAADTFEFLDHQHQHGHHDVIRVCQNRTRRTRHRGGGRRTHLLDHWRSLPAVAHRRVASAASAGAPARDTTVALAWAAVRRQPPVHERGEYRDTPLAVWGLRVWEANPPPEITAPVEWFLLTAVAVASTSDAWERVDGYGCRPVVEELHKGMKTGCDIEAPQFETTAALEPLIAVWSVVALLLLQVRDASRDPERAAQLAAE